MKLVTATDFEPTVKRCLQLIEDKCLFYNEHGLKHPAALYNTSLHKIESDLQEFFDLYRTLTINHFGVERQNENSHVLGQLLNRYRSFLYSLREHLDDSFHIVKTLIPPNEHFRETRNQYNWLNNNSTGDAVKLFLQTIRSYKEFLDNIVNELKHKNGILAWISFIDPRVQDFVLGYYVANINKNRFEPVEKIHSKFKEQYTAFSFGRDIRFNIFQMFKLSEELLALIKRLGIATADVIPAGQPSSQRISLYKSICELPNHVFPDEQTKEVIDIQIKDGQLVLEYPAYMVVPERRHRLVVLSFAGDGMTRDFALLYRTET